MPEEIEQGRVGTKEELRDAILQGASSARDMLELRTHHNIEQRQTDAAFGVAEREENRDLDQEAAYFGSDIEAYPKPELAREQITQQTNDPELIEAEQVRFRPRNDPQREAGIDTSSVENPEIVLNQDKTR